MNAKTKTVVTPIDSTKFHNGIDCVLSLDAVAAKAGLRSLASSIQFSLFSTAAYILFLQEQQERKSDLGISDLDQRNELDLEREAKLRENDPDNPHPMGFEQQEDPNVRLGRLCSLFDGILAEIDARHPSQWDLPRSFADGYANFLSSQGNMRSADESVLLALRDAGIDDKELHAAGEAKKQARIAKLALQQKQIFAIIGAAKEKADADAFVKLPIHRQLALMVTAWKGLFYKRQQLVNYIASSGKLDDLSDIPLLKQGMDRIARWCDAFEAQHAVLLEALTDSGTTVTTIDEAIADTKRRK